MLGIPFEDGGGIAFPFGALHSVRDLAVVHEALGDGQDLTFEVRDGAFVDVETGSQWSLQRKALSGPLAGQRLEMIPEAYVSFWFAFSTFFEDPELWLP